MDPQLANGLATLGALVGGALVKKLSKSKNKTVHEWAAPVVAVGLGIGLDVATGQQVDFNSLLGGSAGANAVLIHSIYYGLRRRR